MKALLGTLIILSAATANAGTAAYNQLIANLNGTNCASALLETLKEVTHPDWNDTFSSLWTFNIAEQADVQAYAIKDAVLHNVGVYRSILPAIKKNLKNGQPNTYYYSWINANLIKHSQEGVTAEQKALARSATGCIKRYLKLNGTTAQQEASVKNAEIFFTQLEGAVK